MKKILKIMFVFMSIMIFSMLDVSAATYLWPVPGVTNISQYYGNGHVGLDIAANGDHDIVAAREGTVIAAASTDCTHINNYPNACCNWGMGNYVQIKHSDGSYATYMHMRYGSVTVSVGQYVSRGTKIGMMGSSGNSTGQHLHFQVGYSSSDTINVNPDSLGYDYENNSDTQAPTVSNMRISNSTDSNFTISADLNDNVGVTRVWLNIYGPSGQNGYAISASNGTFSHTINMADYGGLGNYSIHLYAFDAAGNETAAALNNIYFSSDNQSPTINSLKLKEVGKNTFTISADLTDNVGVTRVWLNIYGPDGQNGYEVSASNGTFTHTINISEYGGFGEYSVHLYAFDKVGNETGTALNHFYIQSNENIFIGVTQTDNSYNINTQIANLTQSAIYTAAMYTANGELIDVKTQPIDSGTTEASANLTKNENASYIKVYLWDNLNSMKPLVECEKIMV